MKTKKDVIGVVKVKAYNIISDTIENGIRRGMIRAHKHTDNPSQEAIEQNIFDAVMLNLDEILDFGD